MLPTTRWALILIGTLFLGLAAVALAELPPGFGTVPNEPLGGVDTALPPLPPPATFPTQLVLDDDTAEGAFGLFGGAARQFMWLNRFANPGSFTLEEIWVLFPNSMDVPLGGSVQLAVYQDPDGNPANGANLLGTYDVTIQAKDGNTFSVYPLAPTVDIMGTGDILIGVVNRYFETGVDPAPTLPAAYDSTASQLRSYFALWAADPPDPPDLSTAVVNLFAGLDTGNFMIRGFGTRAVAPVPVLDGFGLALLIAALGLSGAVLLFRRQ